MKSIGTVDGDCHFFQNVWDTRNAKIPIYHYHGKHFRVAIAKTENAAHQNETNSFRFFSLLFEIECI